MILYALFSLGLWIVGYGVGIASPALDIATNLSTSVINAFNIGISYVVAVEYAIPPLGTPMTLFAMFLAVYALIGVFSVIIMLLKWIRILG